MNTSSPYEFYNDKLGVKIKYIISDKAKSSESIKLICYRSLSHRMNSKTCTERQLRRASLGFDALVEFNSLSQEWRDAITVKFGEPAKQIKKSWFSEHYLADKEAFNFYTGHRYGEDGDKKLKLDLIEKYTYNASVLNTVLKVKTNRKAYAKALGVVKLNIWDSLRKDVNAFRDVPHDLPTTADSLRRKVSQYTKHGYEALISGKLKLKNAQKVKAPEQIALIEELINKHTNLDSVFISDLHNAIAPKMGWEQISAHTVGNIKSSKKLETYAGRHGKKGLKNTLTMQHKRTAPSSSMLYWTLDGWKVELLYQKTGLNAQGHNVTTYHHTLTMVVVLDPFNKYPVGYAIGDRETPALIKQALQNAVSHTKDLFGIHLNPHQLQSDNYQIKNLRPLYERVSANFTPAGIGNSSAKVIEPYFNYLNNKRCKVFDNWSGYNVSTGSKNQPNAEVMNKLKKNFPNEEGLRNQIHGIMQMERSLKSQDYVKSFLNTKPEFRHIMSKENFLLTFGTKTLQNKLRGDGLRVTIGGEYTWFDCFDLNFRKHSNEDWTVYYNEQDLSEAIAVSSDGSYRFPLEQKYIEPMALADRTEADDLQRTRIDGYNRNLHKYIKNNGAERAELIETFFGVNPELNGTTAKLLLTDSNGEHKIHKRRESEAVKKSKKKTISIEAKETKKEESSFEKERDEYYKSTVNVNEYLDN